MENVPKESETIAVKRSARIAEKLKDAGSKMRRSDTWWNSAFFELLLVAFVFFVNFLSVYKYIGSNTVISTAYSGPVIPLLAKLLQFANLPLTHSFQMINLFFFLLFPISFYFFIRKITGRKIIAFLSILITSLPFYPFSEVRVASSLAGLDGAHISSLTITFFALLAIFSFIRDGGVKNLILSSALSALVALTSPFGFSTFLLYSAILAFSEMLLGQGRVKFFRMIAVVLFGASLVSFWYNPSFFFWMLTGSLGAEIRTTVSKLLPMSFFVLPALGAFGYLLFDRKPSLQPVFVASFFTITFSLISLVGGGIFPSHPSRYVPELGISVAFLVSVSLVKLSEALPVLREKKIYSRVISIFVCLVLIVIVYLYKDRLYLEENVLGLWTGVEKGSIWQEREKFGGVSSIFGYLISMAGVSTLTYISARSKVNT